MELSKFSFNFNLYCTVAVWPLANSGIDQVIELLVVSILAEIVQILAFET